MSKLDDILEKYFPNDRAWGVEAKQAVKDLILEIIEESYKERVRAENRVDTYERGTRLLKRILKQKVGEL